MCTCEGDNDSRVYEDERIRDDDKRRALNLTTVQVLAALLATGEVIAAFEQQARHYRQSGHEARECIRDGHRASVRAGGSVSGVVSACLASCRLEHRTTYPARAVAMMRY